MSAIDQRAGSGSCLQLLTALLIVIGVCSIESPTQQRPVDSQRVYTNDDVSSDSGGASTGQASGASEQGPVTTGGVGRVAPFIATPMDVVEKMLLVAGVSASDIVYDLGSGDGRIVMSAAEKYGAKAVGVELDVHLAAESREEVQRRKLGGLVKIIQGDLFETDVAPASVVAVYLLQAANRKLSPILEKQLKPGTRVVAHDIRIPDWKPVEEVSMNSSGVQHFIYLYRVPESFMQ